jgi:hypothetical protein
MVVVDFEFEVEQAVAASVAATLTVALMTHGRGEQVPRS